MCNKVSLAQIKEDLKEIRYYYSRKAHFDNAFKQIASNDSLLEKIQKYSDAMGSAPAFLYDLYISLYTENCTQEGLANNLGFSTVHINQKHKELIQFLQNKLSEGGN